MKKQLIFILFITLSTMANAQTKKPATDYVNVPGPVLFDKQAFNLSWSAHPAENYYKQEYIVKGDNPDKFQTMLLTEILTNESDIKNVVGAKIEELKKMKASNPVVNYEIIQNPKTGEYILDFLLSANGADGTMNIVERNVYRYKTFTDKSGQDGVQLFGVSTRSYGANIDKFFASLKVNRKDLINKVSQAAMPQIKI